MIFPIEVINHILSFRPRHPNAVLIDNYFNRVVYTSYNNQGIINCLYSNRDWCNECGEDTGEGLYCENCGVERSHCKSMIKYTVIRMDEIEEDEGEEDSEDDFFSSLINGM
jgi:hypothetical protein